MNENYNAEPASFEPVTESAQERQTLTCDVKMPQLAIYCAAYINDSHIKKRAAKLLLYTCKVSQAYFALLLDVHKQAKQCTEDDGRARTNSNCGNSGSSTANFGTLTLCKLILAPESMLFDARQQQHRDIYTTAVSSK